jgi:uncharacterized RDD family membrane protein YckC
MNQSEENLFVDTPENITFGYEIAGIGSRFLAALVDTTLILLLQILVNAVMILILSKSVDMSEIVSSGKIFNSPVSWVIGLMGLIAFFFLWGYYIFFEMLWNGQSPGKVLAKLRVIRVNGTPITLTESIIRNLVRVIDFLPLYYGIGVIAMFINSQSRRLGDLAAGTLVVREHTERISLKSLAQPAVSVSALGVAAGQEYPVERLTQQDIRMIESFLKRRQELNNRPFLAQQIARSILARMDIPESELQSRGAEEILSAALHSYRSRQDFAGQ